jgi:signal transduction histidine kinase
MNEARDPGAGTDKNQRILVIDDNRAIHDDFRKILCPNQTGGSALAEAEAKLFSEPTTKASQPASFETDSAFQGQEGVELLRKSREQGRPYSVAFVDMRMPPGWDGIETIKKLWEIDLDLQVVICTAYSDHSWDDIVNQLGNSDRLLLLKKPFDPVEILQLATALTEKWRLNRQVKRQMNDLERMVSERTKQLQRALEDLKSAQDQVVQQERLHALGGMASGIAHDFNNALVGILGLSELLLLRPENLDDKPKAKRYLEMINTTARDAGKIVNRLREFYRFREKQEVLEMTDLNHLVEEAITMTQPKWKTQTEAQNISIEVRKELQKIPAISGNVAEMRESLTNLIFNAVDAMPQGGTITIRTYSIGDQVVLEVSDTGKGMSEDVRRRCLEPFFTTKGVHGTGLGLSMVYGVVQRHHGTIEVKSEVGKGTTFIIRFAAQSAPQKKAAPAPATANAVQSLRILVVDDEPMVRNIVSEYLKGDGHTVEIADGGCAGVEKFRKDIFDLVLVDRAMPDMNGDEVAAAIKSINPAMPVIMLTGFGSMMQANDEKPSGVDLVVGKPVTIADMRAAIACAIGLQVA